MSGIQTGLQNRTSVFLFFAKKNVIVSYAYQILHYVTTVRQQ